MAQSVERRIGSAEVTGPIPVSSSFEKSGNLESIRVPLFCMPESLQAVKCQSVFGILSGK